MIAVALALAALQEKESFLEDASVLPSFHPPTAVRRLPWPFPGDAKKQALCNNYQQPTDDHIYVHAGLDLLHPVGTEVRAVSFGYVVFIGTNYPQWTTHHFFVVAPTMTASEGWCYTHVDPKSFTFKEGDAVNQGQVLGKLVDFRLHGVDHLHLNYVRFTKKPGGGADLESLFDPLLCFDWEDKSPPVVTDPIRFVRAGTLSEFPHGRDGAAIVSGAVDIVAGIADSAFPTQAENFGPAVVTLEIRGEKSKPWRKLVLDQRGAIADPRAAQALWLTHEAAKTYPETKSPSLIVHMAVVTHTDGNGTIEAADAGQCWNTTEKNSAGKPRFPDGEYEVIVRAWDLKGNLGERRAKVLVKS